MSFVEKALQKMQSAQPANVGRAAPVPGDSIAHTTAGQLPPATPLHNDSPANARLVLDALPVLNIDREFLREQGLLPTVAQERQIGGQFRNIKRSVIGAVLDDQPNDPKIVPRSIMVTSALSGDGKTFSCFNLAFSLALERDWTVVLVDADVLKPQMTSLLKASDRRGLLDVIADPAMSVTDAVVRTNISGLYFLPAGQRDAAATEMLSSQRMLAVLKQLTGMAPNILVLFDSPPMLLTSEARALMGSMQQILLVVKAGTTPQNAVRETVNLFAGAGTRAAIVLNNVQAEGLGIYSYGYGYGSADDHPHV